MPQLSFDPQKTALVAIDLQNAIVSLTTAPYAAAEVVKKNRQIAEALRAKGGLIVWVRVDINRFLNPPVDQPPQFGGGPMPDELSELVPSAGFQEGDLLITKPHW